MVYGHKDMEMKHFTTKNSDNITKAVYCLDLFSKNWCMNCEETERVNDLVFNCDKCEFETDKQICLVKKFAQNHKHDYPLKDFGSMTDF